jgi:hypothetical protein
VSSSPALAPAAEPLPLTLRLRALHAPKEGNSEREYEDAFAAQKLAPTTGSTPPTSFTVAVSDGASSSVFAREWARLLVADFSRGPFPHSAGEASARIAALGKTWRQQVQNGALPWYAEEKLTQGSHASLLVVTWDLTGKRTFSARALGDSCLFVVRGGDRLCHAFPVTRAADFGNHPRLLSTETAGTAGNDPPLPFVALDRPYEPGDRFFLMTDALAHWFLARHEAGEKPWEIVPTERALFPGWLQARRDDGSLKNDDVTLLVLSVLPAAQA